MTFTNTPATPSPSPETPAPATPTSPVTPSADATAPIGSALGIAQRLAAGTVDTRQAALLAKAANVDTLAVARAMHTLRQVGESQQDTRSPEVKALDAQFPPGRPEEFVIRFGEGGQEPVMTPELKEFDTAARGWLASAGFERNIGNSLVNAISKVSHTTKDMSPDQLEQYGYAEYARLQAAHGPALEAKLIRAGEMVEILEKQRPGLKAVLQRVGDNSVIANLIIHQAERFWARRR